MFAHILDGYKKYLIQQNNYGRTKNKS